MSVVGTPGHPIIPPKANVALVGKDGALTVTGLQVLTQLVQVLNGISPFFSTGTGSPNGVVTSPPGAIYLNQAGGAGATLWVKESGSGASGWIAK
jgi:hypothetical protein